MTDAQTLVTLGLTDTLEEAQQIVAVLAGNLPKQLKLVDEQDVVFGATPSLGTYVALFEVADSGFLFGLTPAAAHLLIAWLERQLND